MEPEDQQEEIGAKQSNVSEKELRDLFSQPALYIFPTKQGDIRYGTNITDLPPHQALAYLQIAVTQLSAEIVSSAMQQRVSEQQRANAAATRLILPTM